jgi:methyl-accepting chemotaxis protein
VKGIAMDSINEAIKMIDEFEKRNAEMVNEITTQIEALTKQINSITELLRIEHIKPDA